MRIRKIRKLERDFEKIVESRYGADGFAVIEQVEIDLMTPDGKPCIVLKGHWGFEDEAGEMHNVYFEIFRPDGRSWEFIKGIFYRETEYR